MNTPCRASTVSDVSKKSNLCRSLNHRSSSHLIFDPKLRNEHLKHTVSSENFKKNFNSPILICEVNSINIDLPPIIWNGYDFQPKALTLKNTGRTLLINGRWTCGRPYITGGPLNGNYIFSQVHFHCPSEHQVNGVRYPLEMHVVHYKTSYLTQEKAMYEKDGTIVLVYLFQVSDSAVGKLSFVTNFLESVNTKNSSVELPKISLDQLFSPFRSNYFLYSGSVDTEKNSYLLQWFVHNKIASVTRKEINSLLKILDLCKPFSELSKMKPQNGDVFYVEDDCWLPEPVPPKVESQGRMSTSASQTSNKYVSPYFRKLPWSKSKELRRTDSNASKQEKKQVKIVTVDKSTSTTSTSSLCDCMNKKSRKSLKEQSTRDDGTDNDDSGLSDTKIKQKTSQKTLQKKKSSDSLKFKDDGEVIRFKKKEKIKEIKENVKKKEKPRENKSVKSSSFIDDNNDDNIRTIYQKSQKIKFKKNLKDEATNSKKKESAEDVKVNFLLTPSNMKENFLNAVDLTDSKILEVKENTQISNNCVNIPTQILVKRRSCSEMNISESNDENEPKEFCLLMEHFFRARNDPEKPQKWNFQEYHVSIEYENNILQEYNGILALDRLTTEGYEKVDLVPKYNDPENLSIALTDCSIKLNSWEEIRLRSKFIIKEAALVGGIFHEKSTQGLMRVLDAETQYAIQEVEVKALKNPAKSNLTVEKCLVNHLSKNDSNEGNPLMTNTFPDELHNKLHDELRSESHDKRQNELRGTSQQESDQDKKNPLKIKNDSDDLMNIKLKSLDRDNKKILDDPIINFNDLISNDNEANAKIMEKKPEKSKIDKLNANESIEKEWKREKEPKINIQKQHSATPNQSKFFVYDRIERDLISGKKIFVGSFRKKDEVKYFKKYNSSRLAENSQNVAGFTDDKEKIEWRKIPLTESIEIKDSELERIENWCNEQLKSKSYKNSTETKSSEGSRFDFSSLQKGSSINFDRLSNSLKSERQKLLVGKMIGQVSSEVSAISNGANVIQNAKPDVLELGKNNETMNLSLGTNTSTDSRKNPGKSTASSSGTNKENRSISSELKGSTGKSFYKQEKDFGGKSKISTNKMFADSNKSARSTKSESAIIVIPIQVESLSKIELILVEHTNDAKKENTDKEYIPCLNCYK